MPFDLQNGYSHPNKAILCFILGLMRARDAVVAEKNTVVAMWDRAVAYYLSERDALRVQVAEMHQKETSTAAMGEF